MPQPSKARAVRSRRLNSVVICVSLLAFGALGWLSGQHTQGAQSFLLKQHASRKAEPFEATGSIFASIISYRDHECAGTVENMFDQADYPERIYAGVAEQNMELSGSVEDCSLGHMPARLRDNVKFNRINSTEARGIPLARHLAAVLYNGQDFFMQIDAHSRFLPGWDTKVIRMYEEVRKCSKKPVLSHYPLNWGDEHKKAVPRICNGSFNPDGIFRLSAAYEFQPDGYFVRSPFAAGGYMFMDGKVLSEVPHDPDLPYLFDGDEILYSVRLFTNGWDVYTPTENILTHHYNVGKTKKISVYDDHNEKYNWLQKQAQIKVRWLMGQSSEKPDDVLLRNITRMNLGKARPLSEWENFANINLANRKGDAGAKFCSHDIPREPDRVCPGSSAAAQQKP